MEVKVLEVKGENFHIMGILVMIDNFSKSNFSTVTVCTVPTIDNNLLMKEITVTLLS